MAPLSRAGMAVAAVFLLLGLLAAPAGTAADAAAAGAHGCPMCGAAKPAAAGVTLPQGCGAIVGNAVDMLADDRVPLPAGPPPLGPQQPGGANGDAIGPILDKPPSPEMCEALTAAVNAQVGKLRTCVLVRTDTKLITAPIVLGRLAQSDVLNPCAQCTVAAFSERMRKGSLSLQLQLTAARLTNTRFSPHALAKQDRAAHFERAFGADGAGLQCEALVASAKAAMAREVSLAAVPGPEHEHLRRGRGRWHRSRLYHAMRQVCGRSPVAHPILGILHQSWAVQRVIHPFFDLQQDAGDSDAHSSWHHVLCRCI